ncbi:MAG: zinc ribbon domain-containing protein [Methanomicrobiales archaeon]|nr:zinc ribbon domain-containing protein [Methanomicrobiales archaeon]
MESDLLWPICQSCARPLVREEDFGTNADGTRNEDYCITCYAEGKFTRRDLTLEEIVSEVVEQISHRTGMPRSRAEGVTRSIIPGLKRWR